MKRKISSFVCALFAGLLSGCAATMNSANRNENSMTSLTSENDVTTKTPTTTPSVPTVDFDDIAIKSDSEHTLPESDDKGFNINVEEELNPECIPSIKDNMLGYVNAGKYNKFDYLGKNVIDQYIAESNETNFGKQATLLHSTVYSNDCVIGNGLLGYQENDEPYICENVSQKTFCVDDLLIEFVETGSEKAFYADPDSPSADYIAEELVYSAISFASAEGFETKVGIDINSQGFLHAYFESFNSGLISSFEFLALFEGDPLTTDLWYFSYKQRTLNVVDEYGGLLGNPDLVYYMENSIKFYSGERTTYDKKNELISLATYPRYYTFSYDGVVGEAALNESHNNFSSYMEKSRISGNLIFDFNDFSTKIDSDFNVSFNVESGTTLNVDLELLVYYLAYNYDEQKYEFVLDESTLNINFACGIELPENVEIIKYDGNSYLYFGECEGTYNVSYNLKSSIDLNRVSTGTLSITRIEEGK